MRPRRPAVARPALAALLSLSVIATTPAAARAAGATADRGRLVAGAGQVSETASHTHVRTPTSYQPEAGETFLVSSGPTNWNPHAAAAVGRAGLDANPVLDGILAPVLPSVFEVGPGYQVRLNTAFVTSARQVRAHPQTVVYAINPQATWSDGTPITYRDFVYNWQAQSGRPGFEDLGGQPFRPASTDGYRDVASVTEVGHDPYRVKVVFKRPDPDWQALFSLMLPAHVAAQVGFDTGFTDPVSDVSGGPFEVQSYVPGISVTLVRNPRYWGAPANLAEVTFRFVTSADEVLPSLVNGEVDAGAPAPGPGLAAALRRAVSRHPVTGQALPGFTVEDVPGPEWEHLDFNEANPFLARVAVRRALMMAVDRPRLLAATIGRDDPSVRALGNLVFVPGQAGYRNDAGVYGTGNVAGARSALLQAGYSYQGQALTRGGKQVTLRIVAAAGNPLLLAEERVIAHQLAAVGIAVSVGTSNDLAATLRSGGFDLALEVSEASPFLTEAADRYHTNTGSGAGSENFDRYSSRATDALLAEAARAADPARRRRLYQQLDAQLWSDAVSLPLYQVPQLLVFDGQYLNMADDAGPGGVTWDIARWGVAASS